KPIVEASSRFRSLVTICPATENNLSHSADIGATVSKSSAILLSFGYLSRLLCQYSYGSMTKASESSRLRCHSSYSSRSRPTTQGDEGDAPPGDASLA